MMPPTVMLVEDDAGDEFLTSEGLRRSGIPLCPSVWYDGPEALRRLLNPLFPLPALLLLDYRMPKLGGLDILIALRSNPRTHRVPIVILSSELSPRQVAECRTHGVTACMKKPMVADEYVNEVALMVQFFLGANVLPPAGPPPQAVALSGAARLLGFDTLKRAV